MLANPSAYLNGEKIPAAEAQVSAFDLGFTMGVSVTEQIRTYARQTPLLGRHLDRLFGGLAIIGLTAPFSREALDWHRLMGRPTLARQRWFIPTNLKGLTRQPRSRVAYG